MKLHIILLVLTVLHQEAVNVDCISVSSLVQDKLSSITQWLDSVSDATIFDYIFRVNRGVGLNLFEGDINGYNPKRSQQRTAITDRTQLWNTRIVPYVIDPSFDSASRKELQAAIEEYHTKTCIRFVPKTTETDYIHIKQISGCYSNVGRTGGGQEISLAGACLKKGTAVHELMHSLGFWHEQSRPDRDSWVQIISGNIQQGKSYNFEKLPASEVDTLGVQYDYGSVMHYSKYAFSRNGNPTIIPTRQTDTELGQRDGLSDRDVTRIRTLYRCDSPQTSTVTTAKPKPTIPPQTNPPATNPPVTNPPQTAPPQTNPPVTNPPPQTNPPVTNPPQTAPPQTNLPATNPPQTAPPATNPPQTAPPATNPPQTAPPQTNPPVTNPPQTNPPATNPPQTVPPQTNPQPIYQQGWTFWSAWSVCNSECRHSRYRFCLSYDTSECPGSNTEVADCPLPCTTYVSIGCWKQDIAKPTIPSAEGMAPELMIPYKDRIQPVRSCADFASAQGYTAFALVDGGGCLTGPDAHKVFRQAGASNMCGYKGTGGPQSMNVYSFEADIDGEWSLWTSWSHCTRSCGYGRQYRYRRCDNPPPVGRGATCPGESQEVVVCNPAICVAPVTCGNRYHVGGPGSSGLIWVRDYQNFMECDYQIVTGDPMGTISVLIHELDVEFSRGCIYDSLMLYDGPSYRSPLVGTFCGTDSPGRFESSGNQVYIKFQSDETNTGHGFTIFYNINSRSKKACVRPPRSAHVTISTEGNMVGDRTWYHCEPGYTMVGRSPITCTDQPGFALWDNFFPQCVNMRKKRAVVRTPRMCTFEESLCGFINNKDNDFNWSVYVQPRESIGNTSQLATSEARQENVRGNYLQTTSSQFQEPGDLARINSGFYGYATRSYCLSFWYKIDGGAMSGLNLYVKPTNNETAIEDSDATAQRLLWQQTGNDVNIWHHTRVIVEQPISFEIVFEADVATEIGSSVAIDDVILTDGVC